MSGSIAVPMQCDILQKEISRNADGTLTRKWYYSRKEIECCTPSRSDGVDYKMEQHLRKLYCSFLQELGIELKVPQVTIATAMMFCHRFYMRQSHGKNDWQTVATACMFLACKAEETPRWLGELVVVAYKLIYKWDPSASRRIREIYDKQKELILIGEILLLNSLAFDLNIEHPYKSLVAALKRLRITDKELVKVAWNFVNDWLRTSLCLQHKPHYIAAGSLFLAAKVKKVNLPTSKGKAWWMEFDVSPKQLEDVIQQMTSLWDQSQTQTDKFLTTKLKILNGSNTTTIYSKDVGEHTKSKPSNCLKKLLEAHQETSRRTPNCQTSDTGSATSVVEDNDSGEPVTVGGTAGSCQVDLNGIREKIKKRNLIKTIKRKRVEEMDDEIDGEAWIERELENGIVLDSSKI